MTETETVRSVDFAREAVLSDVGLFGCRKLCGTCAACVSRTQAEKDCDDRARELAHVVAGMRDEIDDLDVEIVRLLRRRVAMSERVIRAKVALGLRVYDPTRERMIAATAGQGPERGILLAIVRGCREAACARLGLPDDDAAHIRQT